MPRHYATRDFFRQMPNALLAHDFSAGEGLQEFDFAAMNETGSTRCSIRGGATRSGARSPGNRVTPDLRHGSCCKSSESCADDDRPCVPACQQARERIWVSDGGAVSELDRGSGGMV